ncbi:MAG: hypothetical protein ACM336_05660 [Acidobacteriota bacterium]
MPEPEDFLRLRTDLDTLQQAAGLELPFTPDHVRALLVGAASGAVCLLWAWLSRGLDSWLRFAVAWLITLGPILVYCYLKGISWLGPCDYQRRIAAPLLAVVAFGMGLNAWLVRGHYIKPEAIEMVFGAMLALFAFSVAFYNRRWRSFAVIGAAFLLLPIARFALRVPLEDFFPWELGVLWLVGGLAQAAIWKHQLTQAGQWE